MKSLIDILELSEQEIMELVNTAGDIIDHPAEYAHKCDGKILATLFFEPSTRTRLSFESAMLSLGGKGVISVLSNIAPQQTHDMVQKFFDGDVAGAAKMQLDAMNLVNALFCEVNPIPVKKAVELMGLAGGTVRLPMTEIEPQNAERLAGAMREYGLLD